MVKRKISFGELKLDRRVDRYWNQIKDSNWISIGPLVKEFEDRVAHLFRVKHAIGMSNGTDANINALLSLYDIADAAPGDEIICPSLCFYSVASSIIAAGFKPVFVDIEKETLNINPCLIENKLTEKTKAILAVNTMGKPVYIEPLKRITEEYNLKLIIDNCEGIGSTYLGKFIEHYCDISTCSCYQAHLIQSGEFGFCFTNNNQIANILKSTRTHGRRNGENDFYHDRLGYNSKPTDIHAMIGLSKIDDFWLRYNTRKNNIKRIRNGLEGYKKYMWFSEEEEQYVNSPHAFSIVFKDKDHNINRFKKHLSSYGIQWKLNFGCLPTQQKGLKKFVKDDEFEVEENSHAEFVGKMGIHFGCHEYLSSDDCDYIVNVIRLYFDNKIWEKYDD